MFAIAVTAIALAASAWTKADYPVWKGTFDPAAKTGWTVQYFGDPAFALMCGVKSYPGELVRVDFGRDSGSDGCRWPERNYDERKGPTFSRGALSAAAFSRLAVPADGEYAFEAASQASDTCVWRVQVDGCDLRERDGRIRLKRGTADVALYGRQDQTKRGWPFAIVKLRWRKPGDAAFSDVPAAALRPDPKDADRVAVPIAHEFRYGDGRIDYHAYRSWDFNVPTDGVYRIVVHQGSFQAYQRLCLDGLQIGFWQSREDLCGQGCYSGEVDRTGRTDRYRCDFYGRWAFVRRLAGGRHTLDFFANPGPWFWDDKMHRLMVQGTLRVGWEPVDGKNPDSSAGFWFEGRDDLVLARGERLEVSRVNAAGCTLKVDGRAVPDWTLPSDAEGVHRLVVENARGEVVWGPWEYPVVGVKEVKSKKEKGESADVPSRVVDCVTCDEGAGGAHRFRDNGTSEVRTSKDGVKYRIVGATGLHGVAYNFVDRRLRDKGIVPVRPGEKGETSRTAEDWFAYSLKVEHPGVPHVLKFTSPNLGTRPKINSVYAIDPKTGQYNGWNLMTDVGPATGPTSACGFFLWPNTNWVDVLVVNTDGNHNSKDDRRSAVVSLELAEYPDGLPPLEEPAVGWQRGRDFGWEGEQVDLGVNERTMPDLLPPGTMVGVTENSHIHRDWKALMTAWDRFGDFSAWRGDNLVYQPVNTYGMLLYRGRAERLTYPDGDVFIRGRNNRVVDPFDRDIFKLMLLEAGKRGVRLVADCMIQRITSETVAEWAAAYGRPAETNGLLLSESPDGSPFRSFSGCFFPNPAHPVARRRMTEFCGELGRRYGRHPAFAGIRHRFWRAWPASFEPTFYKESLGFDDWTVAKFAKDKQVDVPNLPYAERKAYVLKNFRRLWERWRTEQVLSLHEEMLAALRAHAPNAQFYAQNAGEGAGSESVWIRAAGLDPAAFEGRRELGYLKEQAYVMGPDVEINHLDPQCFAAFNVREGRFANPVVSNGVYHAFAYPQGLCCNRTYKAAPYHLEPAAKALANGALNQLLAGGQWCLPPADEPLRRFVRAYRAIPDVAYARVDGTDVVAVWQAADAKGVTFYAVNRTDRRCSVTVTLDGTAKAAADCVTGERRQDVGRIALALPPFEPAVWRVLGDHRVVRVSVPVEADERAALEKALRFILSFDDWDCREASTPLIRAMRESRERGDWEALRRQLSAFRRDHLQWYEMHAWPADWHVYRPVWRKEISGTYREERCEYRILTEDVGRPNVKFPEISKEGFYVAKKGERVAFRLAGSVGGYRHLVITALFGGGYGPIDLFCDGKPLGTFRAGTTAEPRLETRTFKLPLACPGNSIKFELVGRGEKGLALNRMTKEIVSQPSIRKWAVLGPFTKKGGAKDLASMEERFFDPLAKDADWTKFRPVELADGEETLDLHKVFGTAGREDVTAYLVTYVKGRCGTTFGYTSSFFGKIWIGGTEFCPEMRGPDEAWTSAFAHLKGEAGGGWTRIVVKVSPGADGRWFFGGRLLDCHGFEYANRPPQ